MINLIRTSLFLPLCLCYSALSGQLHGQITYAVTGEVVNSDTNTIVPQVSFGETYVAEFLFDLTSPDNSSAEFRGEYLGAILSSSIEFSGGYISQVDFTGGDIIVLNDFFGGDGIGFISAQEDVLGVFDTDTTTLASDGLLISSSSPFATDPSTRGFQLSLDEPSGSILLDGQGAFVVSVPEPSGIYLLAIGGLAVVARRRHL